MKQRNEDRLVQKVLEWAKTHASFARKEVEVDIGDDASVFSLLDARSRLVATTDSLVDGIHFKSSYYTAQELGYKLLAINLSDLASMGDVKPRFLLTSLVVKKGRKNKEDAQAFVLNIYKGMEKLLTKYKIHVIGGNLTRSHHEHSLHMTLIGELAIKAKPKLRSLARAGDLVAVTSKKTNVISLGDSALGLYCLTHRYTQSKVEKSLIHSHKHPIPRVDEAQALGRFRGVHALMDISDGLFLDGKRLAIASNIQMVLYRDAFSFDPNIIRFCKSHGLSPFEMAMGGGEDYELLFTYDKKIQSSLDRVLQGRYQIIGEVCEKKYKTSPPVIIINGMTQDEFSIKIKHEGWDPFRY